MSPPPRTVCPRCSLRLRAADHTVFADTVFAENAHDCARARKILNEASRGALLFATHREFVHARLINPGITSDAWIELLQTQTATHDLAHRVFTYDEEQGAPPGVEVVLVISTRVDFEPDIAEIRRGIAQQLRAAWG